MSITPRLKPGLVETRALIDYPKCFEHYVTQEGQGWRKLQAFKIIRAQSELSDSVNMKGGSLLLPIAKARGFRSEDFYE